MSTYMASFWENAYPMLKKELKGVKVIPEPQFSNMKRIIETRLPLYGKLLMIVHKPHEQLENLAFVALRKHGYSPAALKDIAGGRIPVAVNNILFFIIYFLLFHRSQMFYYLMGNNNRPFFLLIYP